MVTYTPTWFEFKAGRRGDTVLAAQRLANRSVALKDALTKLVEQKELRESISKFNSVGAQDYTVEKCAQRYENILKDALPRDS